ncbi:unnamed protein product [Dovyalis caffra]|uniref:Apple domain-containing protein n=1 Tax=Dovyalis caffra TaxID=77055 RepID=A0AAV1SH43_9ROSI|nr:unnamed protein product [Dovyalis caffra]
MAQSPTIDANVKDEVPLDSMLLVIAGGGFWFGVRSVWCVISVGAGLGDGGGARYITYGEVIVLIMEVVSYGGWVLVRFGQWAVGFAWAAGQWELQQQRWLDCGIRAVTVVDKRMMAWGEAINGGLEVMVSWQYKRTEGSEEDDGCMGERKEVCGGVYSGLERDSGVCRLGGRLPWRREEATVLVELSWWREFMVKGDRSGGVEWFVEAGVKDGADDPGVGDYSFKVNPNGSPQFFLYKGTNPSWRTAPWPWKGHRNLYHLIFINNQDEISLSYNVPDGSVIMRKMLDHSGFISVATWHGSDGKWKEFWKAPQFRCDSYGKCGAYSTCQSADVVMFECACLPGYEPKYPRDWFLRDGSGGCVRKRLESSSVCGKGEGFVKVEIVFLPDTSAAVWMDMSTTGPNCELECKRNCSCSAYSVIDIPGNQSGCLTWYGELMDIISDREERSDLYIRVDALELGIVLLPGTNSN